MRLTLGEKLKDLRTERKMTSKQVCNEIEKQYGYSLSVGKYNEMESDVDKDFGYRAFIYLAKFYNVSSDYLLGLSEIKSISPKIQAICKYTGLNELTTMSFHSFKDVPFSPATLINFICQNGGFGDLSILLEKLKNEIDALLYEKKHLNDEIEKMNNITTIDDKFIYSQAIQGLSPIKEICNKIISIKDNLEFTRFRIQRAILRRIDIYEEQEVQKSNAEHNSTKE